MHALKSVSRIASMIAIGANVIGTLCVLCLVVVVNTDIVSRDAFNAPMMGAIEIVQFSMVLIVFLQLPDVVRANRLTRSDGFLLIATKRWPLLARRLGQLIDIIAGLFMVAIAWSIWPEFLEMLETQDYFGVPGVFTAPWWPIKLVIFCSAFLCGIVFAFRVIFPDGDAVASSATVGDVL